MECYTPPAMSMPSDPAAKVLPFDSEPEAVHQLDRVKLGMWFFLVSEAVLFITLFVLYGILRAQADAWPRGRDYLSLPIGAANAAVLVFSSITMVLAWAAVLRRHREGYRLAMGITVAAGGVYLLLKGLEYHAKISQGLLPNTNLFLGLYYTVTGVHILHAVGGVLYNAWLLGPGSRDWHVRPQAFRTRVEAAGLFWHFVDLMWLFIFPLLYVL